MKILHYDRIDVSEGIMVVRQVHKKSVLFATNGIFQMKGLSFNQMSSMGVTIY